MASTDAIRWPAAATVTYLALAALVIVRIRPPLWLDLAVGAVFLLIFGVSVLVLRDDLKRIGHARVESVDGHAEHQLEEPVRGVVIDKVRVGDMVLSLGPALGARFVEGGPYRFYYLPGMNHVVGVEVLPGWTEGRRH